MFRRIREPRPRKGSPSGFTLIELLVVVAIMSLLISILLPSLSKARAQTRTTVCLTRISQLTKAMMMYADDFNETPPFIIKSAHDDKPLDNNGENRRKETWLASASTMQRIYAIPEEDWYTAGDPRLPNSGDLFGYTRFPDLYRCPEFQRETSSDRDQNAFNYTRNLLGRKMDVSDPMDIKTGDIIKISGVYNSARLPMMLEEAWNCYVAWPIQKNYVWGGHDPMMDLLNSCIGQYHGAPTPGWAWYPDSEPQGSINGAMRNVPCRQGSVAYYDGHAELMRDPIPNLEHSGGRADIEGGLTSYTNEYLRWIADFLYAQQGMALNIGF